MGAVGNDEALNQGLRTLGDECRRRVVALRSMMRYAREMSFRDPRRVVESLGQALEELDELGVDLELALGGMATVCGTVKNAIVASPGVQPGVTPRVIDRYGVTDAVVPVEVSELIVSQEPVGRAVPKAVQSAVEVEPQSAGGDKHEVKGRSIKRVTMPDGRDFSDEQLESIECTADDVGIDSGAGCGKTAVLDGYARARPKEKMLYIAFSRGVADEAKSRFPKSVKCINQHSLAFADIGARYQGKLGKPKARQVLSFLEDKKRLPVADERDKDGLAQLALETVDGYLASGSWQAEITASDAEDGYLLPSGRHIEGRFVAAAAQSLWEGMQNLDEGRIPMVQDGYCKLWALRRPNLSRYSRILLDEGQDANASLLQVLLAQDCGRVFVGDDRQRIFGFRRAINAMDQLQGAARRTLKTSYRFGNEIAEMANDLLSEFLPGGMRLIGGGGNKEPDGSTAAVFRTNAGIFSAAAEWIDLRDGKQGARTSGVMGGLGTDKGMHFVGGLASYQFESIVDLFQLSAGNKHLIRDEFMKRFATYESLQAYAEQVKDRELLARVSVVDRFGDRVPYLAEAMKAAHVAADRANVSLCSAHKSKGLEWDTVLFGEDYTNLMSRQGLPRSMGFASCEEEVVDVVSDEEVRLIYVVLTRGRKKVVPGKSVRDFLDWKRGQGATGSGQVR